MADETLNANEFIDALNRHIWQAGCNQSAKRGSAPEHKPKTWEEIEAYAEWRGAIRAREALLNLKEEVDQELWKAPV